MGSGYTGLCLVGETAGPADERSDDSGGDNMGPAESRVEVVLPRAGTVASRRGVRARCRS